MTLYLSNACARACANAITAQVDAGAGAGKVKIYAGTVPADADASLGAATLLGTLTLSDPSFGAAADVNPNARITASAITEDSAADATGTASFFRITDSNDVVIMQGTVTAAGGGGDMIINTTAIVVNAAIQMTSLTVTMPE